MDAEPGNTVKQLKLLCKGEHSPLEGSPIIQSVLWKIMKRLGGFFFF